MTPGRLSVAVVLALAALANCGGGGGETTTSLTTTTTAAASTPSQPAPVVETAVVTPTPPPEPKKTYPPPESLKDLDTDRLADLLGPPRLKRRDAPAEIWQYRNDACALDVFLYRTGGIYRVRHFETRGPGVKPVDQNDCFVSLIKAREQARAG